MNPLRKIYKNSNAEISNNIQDVEEKDIQKCVYALIKDGILIASGGLKNRKYTLAKKK